MPLHHVDLDIIAEISELRFASVFRTEVSKVGGCYVGSGPTEEQVQETTQKSPVLDIKRP